MEDGSQIGLVRVRSGLSNWGVRDGSDEAEQDGGKSHDVAQTAEVAKVGWRNSVGEHWKEGKRSETTGIAELKAGRRANSLQNQRN